MANFPLRLLIALLTLTFAAHAQGVPQPKPVTAQQMADYRAKLAVYQAVHGQFDAEASAYWATIAERRKTRNAKRRNGETILATDYVLTQPPVYSGPPRPIDPSGATPPPTPRAPLPVVANFLQNAMAHFQFAPRKPAAEVDYKRAYARVASSFGLTKDQAVRIYGFESGGNGKYDVQAGLESEKPGAHAISTALGYNQLLTTNTIDLLAEHGAIIVNELRNSAATMPQRQDIEHKIATVQRMIAFCKTVANEWYAHERLGTTPQGIGVHALNLDIDVGPILQTLKLMDSVNFAKRKGYTAPLGAAELEMMNLTGDGNGFDMVSMPQALRVQVPTSNFFQRGGYERNPVAIRNNTVSKLIAATDAKMDKEVTLQGAKDLAAAF
jgi:hypothetical protein